MKFQCIQRFFNSSVSISKRIDQIRTSKRSYNLVDGGILFFILIFVGYSWNLDMIFEGFTKVSGSAGSGEILYLLKRIVVFDIIPMALLLLIFKYVTSENKWSKLFELTIAVWTQSALLRIAFDGIPNIAPTVHFYPIPYFEIPQVIAYGNALLTLSVAANKYKKHSKPSKHKSKDKDKVKSKAAIYEKLSVGWVAVVLLAVTLLYWMPLLKSYPLFIKAPAFVMPSTDGKTCDLAAQKGKTVLLEFWSYRCPHCRKQAEQIDQLADEIDSSKVTIFSIHTHGGEKMAKIMEKYVHNKKITLCLDDGTVSDVYRQLPKYQRIHGVPHMLIVDKNGIIRKVIRGEKSYTLIKAELDKITAR